jgi:hypothetical protein
MNGFARLAAAAYLLLVCVYAIFYWADVDYFADDWILLPQFRDAAAGGLAGIAEFAARAAQNRVYEVFRTQWLSILYGFAVTWLGGYSVKFNFALLLALHAANAWLLADGLRRLGAARQAAFLAGALQAVLPTTHFVLFTYFTNPFFVFCTFWVLLMQWWWAAMPERRWPMLPVLAVAGLFAGEQSFVLVWVILPLAAWSSGKPGWRAARRPIGCVWAGLVVAAAAYVTLVTSVPLREGRRHLWTWRVLSENLDMIGKQWWRLTGLPPEAPFRLHPAAGDLVAAAVAGAVVWSLARAWRQEGTRLPRGLLFGVLALLAAYAPTLFVEGGFALRYHYTASPFLAWLLALGCQALGRRLAPAAGALLAGFFVLTAASHLRQAWIPASQHHRTFRAEVERLENLEPGDFVVVIGAPLETGAVQHFSLHSADTAGPFVEYIRQVRPVTAALGLVHRHPGLALFLKYNHYRAITPDELRRTHLLVYTPRGSFEKPEWVASEAGNGRFELLPLKAASGDGSWRGVSFTRDQLLLRQRRVFFP